MQLNREYTFDASPQQVYEMFTDEAYVRRRLEQTGSLSSSVDLTRDGDRAQIRTHRVLPPRVPAYAKRFVGDTVELDEVQQWHPAEADGSREGSFSIAITGAPVRLESIATLSPTASGSVYRVIGTVTSSVPLFGRKLEEAAAPAVVMALDKEAEVSRDWLAGRR